MEITYCSKLDCGKFDCCAHQKHAVRGTIIKLEDMNDGCYFKAPVPEASDLADFCGTLCKFAEDIINRQNEEHKKELENMIKLPCALGDTVKFKFGKRTGIVKEITITDAGFLLCVEHGGCYHLVLPDQVTIQSKEV